MDSNRSNFESKRKSIDLEDEIRRPSERREVLLESNRSKEFGEEEFMSMRGTESLGVEGKEKGKR